MSSSSSVSSSAYYNGDVNDSADSFIARILLSLSSPPPRRNFPPGRWSTTKKRSDIVDQFMSRFDSTLQSKKWRNIDGALKVLKSRYKSNKKILAGIQAFQYLRSQGLNGDQMLKVLDEICNNKRKIGVKSAQQNENPAPKIEEESAKFNNSPELIGEGGDDLIGNYECKEKECKEVFSTSQALGGHTASHNRKKKTEELLLQTRSRSDLKLTEIEGNLCPKSLEQALGGHTTYHRETDDGIHEKKGSSGEQQMIKKIKIRFGIDFNVSPVHQNLSLFPAVGTRVSVN